MINHVQRENGQGELRFLVKLLKEKLSNFIEAMAMGHNYNYIHGNQFIYCTLIVVMLSFSFIGCSKKTASIPELKLSNVLSSNYTPVVYLSAEDGLAEKHGVVPKIEYNDGIEPLITGKVDGRLNNLVATLVSAGNGADIVLFAGTMGGGHMLFANKKVAGELKNLDNWKGHSVGTRIQITPQLVISSWLRDKFGEEGDAVFKYYDSDSAAITACSKGEVDITAVYYSQIETAVSQGLVPLFELTEIAPDYACCRQTANGPKLRSDRNLFVAWTKGLIEAWKVYNTNHDEAIKVIKNVTRQDEQWVYNHIYDKKLTANITFNPDPYYNGVLGQYDVCVNKGYINKEKARALPDYFDISVYADALQEIIKENPDDKFYRDMWKYFVTHNDAYPNFERDYKKEI